MEALQYASPHSNLHKTEGNGKELRSGKYFSTDDRRPCSCFVAHKSAKSKFSLAAVIQSGSFSSLGFCQGRIVKDCQGRKCWRNGF